MGQQCEPEHRADAEYLTYHSYSLSVRPTRRIRRGGRTPTATTITAQLGRRRLHAVVGRRSCRTMTLPLHGCRPSHGLVVKCRRFEVSWSGGKLLGKTLSERHFALRPAGILRL